MIEVAGGCGATGPGRAAGLPGGGQRSRLARCPPPGWDGHTLQGPLLGYWEGWASPSHRGLAFPGACSGLGHSPTAGWRVGWGGAGTPTEPQAPAAQLSWGRRGGGMGIPGLPLHGLRAGPLNLLCCPINRQQPCAAAQLQRLPPASPLPTHRSRCPGDDQLTSSWREANGTAKGAQLGVSTPPEVTLLGGVHTGLRAHSGWGVHIGCRTRFGSGCLHWPQRLSCMEKFFDSWFPGLFPSQARS